MTFLCRSLRRGDGWLRREAGKLGIAVHWPYASFQVLVEIAELLQGAIGTLYMQFRCLLSFSLLQSPTYH